MKNAQPVYSHIHSTPTHYGTLHGPGNIGSEGVYIFQFNVGKRGQTLVSSSRVGEQFLVPAYRISSISEVNPHA